MKKSFFKKRISTRFILLNALSILITSSLLVTTSCSNDETTENLGTTVAAKSSSSVKLAIASATASTSQSPNVASNVFDGDNSTRWSGEGTAVDLILDLGSSQSVDYINIAWLKGDSRSTSFDVYVSNNASNWEKINSKTSTGTTADLETYDLLDSEARYLKLVCKGNTSNNWNSITELEIWGGSGKTVVVDSEPVNLAIANATASTSQSPNVASNVIDGDNTTRWSGQGTSVDLILDLASTPVVDYLNIAWLKGDSRTTSFDVYTSTDASNWTLIKSLSSSGSTADLETYDLPNTTARYVKLLCKGNTSNDWNSITELEIWGTVGGDVIVVESDSDGDGIIDAEDACPTEAGIASLNGCPESDTVIVDGNLDPSKAPSGNFDLSDWYLSIPVNNGSGVATSIKESELNADYSNSSYFYTAADGGMVFNCTVSGYKTSSNTSYTRTELREMMRAGNTSIATSGVCENNWVFGSASSETKAAAGGYDGELTATLAVNYVTTTGSSSQVGRVIVGQIHANSNEPCRLYYRKLPGNSKGSIYFAHETKGGSESWYELIGSKSDSASNPSDGVALDEKFSYSIKVVGDQLTVTIMRDGKSDVSKTVDMSGSGYSTSDQYMYFKAGVYNQNNTGTGSDYVQATFYSLANTHTGYNK
jgi:poly(beta-D-mannuronate) lyase